ncbi:hypothetical protein ASG43_20815 [Aureimonas sp. Leaf454]|uniref:matrixin family metalloprotease n=1 Tax=Aureimonas sp. Leaf454 TaxID=1736381 RepID=UPI0006FCE1A6|nr:matrixin family metalloprotease [Aureimonas sp. Leaf454]KQT51935.1 hypothetical protein ASG43_20815 [Aureimonas sp. Leaf454]
MATSPYTGSHWGTGGTPRVTWSFATLPGELIAFASSIADPAYQSAVRKAFATWESVADIDFVEAADSLANGIRLGWSYIDQAGATLATANWRYVGTEITEAEIRFDLHDRWQPQSGGGGTANFFATAVHEIGHAIGLAHVEERSSIMYAYQTNVAALSADDIAHVREIYGAAHPAVTSSVAASAPSDVFRFYNTETKLHFYTNSAIERDQILASPSKLLFEGTAFKVPGEGAKDAALSVFRFFDSSTNTHFYTASTAERDKVQAEASPWKYEGAAFKAYADAGAGAGGEHLAVHRFLQTTTGTHFYTTSTTEKATIESTLSLFRYEGVAYFVDA